MLKGSSYEKRLVAGKKLASPLPGEQICITGMAGYFPNSINTQDFYNRLMNKENLCDEDTRRWKHNHSEIPKNAGKIWNYDKFDTGFFSISKPEANVLCAMSKLLLERSMEAILDAGVNPKSLEGTNTGVYVGVSHSENEKAAMYEKIIGGCNTLLNCTRSTVAHRISYFLKLNGPSYIADSACSSAMYAMDRAYYDLRTGKCDRAIVCGSNLCLLKYLTLQFARLGVLNMGTGCRPFDSEASGYTRSEAIVAIFLQKERESKRIYAHLIHSKSNNDGFKESGITFPSSEGQLLLFNEIYEECDLDPRKVAFIEAHGTGTKVGDPEEMNAVDQFFCKGRDTPLFVASVKSNIGHTEPASGLCSLVKLILCMESNIIIPNIHYDKPRDDIPSILENRIKIISENTEWPSFSDYAAMNCFGFGGSNCHLALKRNTKIRKYSLDDLPRLICVSGRVQEGVDSILDSAIVSPINYEYIRLIQDIFKEEIPNHLYRGFTIITNEGEYKRSNAPFTPKKVYLCLGNSNKYNGAIVNDFLKVPIFRESYNRFNKILISEKINVNLLEESPKNTLQQLLISVCLQIGIINIFKELGVEFELITSLSLGDFTAAYAVGALTLEESILSIVKITKIFLETPRPEGNLHLKLVQKLKEIIKVGSSFSKKNIHKPRCNIFTYASPEYFTFNIFNPNLLSENRPKFPKNSLIVTLDYNLDSTGVVPMMRPDMKLEDFMFGIGRIYEAGQNLKIHLLYPDIQWPVSRGTPMISPLIKWDHSQVLNINIPDTNQISKKDENYLELSVLRSDQIFYRDHVIDGRNLFPATGYLQLIWEMYANLNGMLWENIKICFENVVYHRAYTIPIDGSCNFYISLMKDGLFEISDNSQSLVTGCISELEDINISKLPKPKESNFILNKKDVYKELRLRGYNYKGLFASIAKYSGETSLVKWADNWVTFLDNLLQLSILQEDSRALYVPTGISRLVIDAEKHLKQMEAIVGDEKLVEVRVDPNTKSICTDFIELIGLSANCISRKRQLAEPVLETYKFIPNHLKETNLEESLRINLHIILENLLENNIKILESIKEENKTVQSLTTYIEEILADLPLVQPFINILSSSPVNIKSATIIEKITEEESFHLYTGIKILEDAKELKNATRALTQNGFIISIEDKTIEKEIDGFTIITIHQTQENVIILLRRKSNVKERVYLNISGLESYKNWLPILQQNIKKSKDVVLYSQEDELNGILGLVNCIRKEPGCVNVRSVFLQDLSQKFNPEDPFFEKQLSKGLAVNVFKENEWGTYRHLRLKDCAKVQTKHCFNKNLVQGNLSTLSWLEGSLSNTKKTNLIKVCYAPINFRDVLLASGKLHADLYTKDRRELECTQGIEFSGINGKNERVMGIASSGAVGTLLNENNCLIWRFPEKWTLEEAATVPVVYSTVLIALKRAEFKPGQSILIHSGTGGIGLAALNICTYYNFNIFVTVGTQEKKDFLIKNYPNLKVSHIGNSRDTSFEQLILKETNGKGVDIILNSLVEEKLLTSVRCLAPGGHFLEIGKYDSARNLQMSLDLFKKGCSFVGIHMDGLFKEFGTNNKNVTWMHNLVNEELKKGYIKPLVRTTFEMDQVEDAIRFMSTGKHIGKVMVEIRKEGNTQDLFEAIPRCYFNPSKFYIILGGLGGFGLELADWLFLRGAQKIVLCSRTGIKTGYQNMRINYWTKSGVDIFICTEDITTYNGCQKMLSQYGPVGGIFNLAVVLKDGILENQNVENFEASIAPKALATLHLDLLSRDLCPDLEYFVVFSSVSCGRGNAGQSNYGMSNSIMERICEKRRKEGFPAVAIQWGAVGDVGLVAEMQKESTEIAIGGTLQQRISSCVEVLDVFLKQTDPIVASMVVAEKTSGSADNMIDAISTIMGMKDLKNISLHSTFAELGMDSMMAVEIKQLLERDFEVFLTPQDIKTLTFDKLMNLNEEKLSLVQDGVSEVDVLSLLVNSIYEEETYNLPVVKIKKDVMKNVIVFPGIEGSYAAIKALSKNLNYGHCCVQYTSQEKIESPEELYHKIKKDLKEEKCDDNFTLIAHSFGTLLAIKVALQLESEGKTGKIIVIDGSPEMMLEITKVFEKKSGKDLESNILLQVLSFYCPPKEIPAIHEKMSSGTCLEERMRIAVNFMPEISIPKEILFGLGYNLTRRTHFMSEMAESLERIKLKSKIILLKSHIKLINVLPEDYYLSKYSEEPVEVMQFEGNHQSILNNKDMVEYINKII